MNEFTCTGKKEDCLNCTLPDCIRPEVNLADKEITLDEKKEKPKKEKRDRKDYHHQYYIKNKEKNLQKAKDRYRRLKENKNEQAD